MFVAQIFRVGIVEVEVGVDDGAGAVVGDGERRIEEVLLDLVLPCDRGIKLCSLRH